MRYTRIEIGGRYRVDLMSRVESILGRFVDVEGELVESISKELRLARNERKRGEERRSYPFSDSF